MMSKMINVRRMVSTTLQFSQLQLHVSGETTREVSH